MDEKINSKYHYRLEVDDIAQYLEFKLRRSSKIGLPVKYGKYVQFVLLGLIVVLSIASLIIDGFKNNSAVFLGLAALTVLVVLMFFPKYSFKRFAARFLEENEGYKEEISLEIEGNILTFKTPSGTTYFNLKDDAPAAAGKVFIFGNDGSVFILPRRVMTDGDLEVFSAIAVVK